jgi:hypothetical protein
MSDLHHRPVQLLLLLERRTVQSRPTMSDLRHRPVLLLLLLLLL